MHNKDRPFDDVERSLDERSPTLRGMIPYCLAILAVAPSILHFAAAGQHFQQSWPLGVVTLIVAWLQLLWAVSVVAQPSRALWWQVGAILSSGIVLVDIVTRMVVTAAGFGLPACILFEALVLAGCAWLLLGKRDQRIARNGQVATYGAVGVATATILSVSLLAGGPAMAAAGSAPRPALDRHGLQADVPLPQTVAFAGVHQTTQVPDMQYHSTISVDTWGWKVSGTKAVAVEQFYAARLPKQGWTNVRWEPAMGGYGNANHLTACQAGEVLLVSTSATTLDALDTTTGHVTATVTAPRPGAAMLIEIDKSPQVSQVACPNPRTS